MLMDIRTIGGRTVTVREGTKDLCLITFYADFDEDSLEELFSRIPDVTIADVRVNDWNQELSPWEAPPVFGKDGFGDGAQNTLDYILNDLIPELGCDRYMIGGYSLAGLFSLWVCYNSDSFIGCAAASPSVWFPEWDSFIKGRTINANKVYLSLGDKEAKTRNQIMRAVVDRIVLQYDVLKDQIGDGVNLEWNPGNHFQDFIGRKSRAVNWLISECR